MICQAHGAVFIEKIGGVLKSGQKHDDRSPDYDDWELNGDIILWNDVLEKALKFPLWASASMQKRWIDS